MTGDYLTNPQAYDQLMARMTVDSYGNQALFDSIQRLQPKSICEIGCGTGVISQGMVSLAERVMITDVDNVFLDYTQRKIGTDKAEYRIFDATQDTLDEQVDLIVGRFVYHHISDDDKQRTLANLRRNITRQGAIVLLDYFLPHYDDESQKASSVERFHRYRFSLFEGYPELLMLEQQTYELADDGEHKVCLRILVDQLAAANLHLSEDMLIRPDSIDDPDLFGMHLLVLKPAGIASDQFNSHNKNSSYNRIRS
ncbi:MAG: class I SAM-dependent methyltransferase [Nanoarchaeota archaeon]|nr:class I SAM-dependent methyltransferase [Nanoarchaeota archaeon]MBU1703942.1 class I SAM-dependent methyltransferase [Nanoarchaeota archaeon]